MSNPAPPRAALPKWAETLRQKYLAAEASTFVLYRNVFDNFLVGDTLHTDVLGGRAAGMGAVLVADHGLFAGRDVRGYIARSGIVPDAVVATT